MKNKILVWTLVTISISVLQVFASAQLAKYEKVAPLLDVPLRDTAITRVEREVNGQKVVRFYLTGTAATILPDGREDFTNNDGIYLWESPDLKNWKFLGKVFGISELEIKPYSSNPLRYFGTPPDTLEPNYIRGLFAPEIHFIKGTFWITYSINRQWNGLLKSVTGNPEGPYENVGLITTWGTDPSLFQDDDGTVYWLMGGGWIARMKEDMSGLAEGLRLIRPYDEQKSFGEQVPWVGRSGAFMFKRNGRYYLCAADIYERLGVPCYDTFVACGTSLDKPFGPRYLAVPHGGQVTMFEGPDGRWYSTFSGIDSRVALKNRPAIVPLEWVTEVMYRSKLPEFPRKNPYVITEAWGWERARPVTDYKLRDLSWIYGNDGFYYMSGLHADERLRFKLVIFRGKDLTGKEPWEPIQVFSSFHEVPWFTEDPKITQTRKGLESCFWRVRLSFADGTFWISYAIWSKNPRHQTGEGLMRSTSGKMTGPFEHVTHGRRVGVPFQDTDGSLYLFHRCTLMPVTKDMRPDRNRVVRDAFGHLLERDHDGWFILRTTDGSSFIRGDVDSYLFMIDGKYVIAATAWHGGYVFSLGPLFSPDRPWGTYDMLLYWSDCLGGPYRPNKTPLPHAGHGGLLRDRDGGWWIGSFANDNFLPDHGLPRLLPIQLRWNGNGFDVGPREP